MTARAIYLMNVSLDGFVNDAQGSLDWSIVDDETHQWFNDRTRDAGALVYGRRLYETMAAYWPTAESDPDGTPVTFEFARLWNERPKIVFSRTLEKAEWADRLLRTNIVDEIAGLKAEFDGELDIGGPTLAAGLIERDLIDEYRVVIHPVILGGGTPFFPAGHRIDLRLIDTHRFENGAVFLAYEPR